MLQPTHCKRMALSAYGGPTGSLGAGATDGPYAGGCGAKRLDNSPVSLCGDAARVEEQDIAAEPSNQGWGLCSEPLGKYLRRVPLALSDLFAD